jgi:hypothetical protein
LVQLDGMKVIGVGDVAGRGRDADRLDVRCELPEHLQPDLERSVVAEVADAEQAEQPDDWSTPAERRPCVPAATMRSPPSEHRHRVSLPQIVVEQPAISMPANRVHSRGRCRAAARGRAQPGLERSPPDVAEMPRHQRA